MRYTPEYLTMLYYVRRYILPTSTNCRIFQTPYNKAIRDSGRRSRAGMERDDIRSYNTFIFLETSNTRTLKDLNNDNSLPPLLPHNPTLRVALHANYSHFLFKYLLYPSPQSDYMIPLKPKLIFQ